MRAPTTTLTVAIVVTAALLAGCSPKSKAHAILEQHEADFIECDQKYVEVDPLLEENLAQLNAGDTDGSRATMDEADKLLTEAEACMAKVKFEIEADREAAGIDKEVFGQAWTGWIAELQNEGKLRKPKAR